MTSQIETLAANLNRLGESDRRFAATVRFVPAYWHKRLCAHIPARWTAEVHDGLPEGVNVYTDGCSSREQAIAELLDALKARGFSGRLKLIERATRPAPAKIDVGSMIGVMNLFAKARDHLKRPAIVLTTGEVEVRLSLAGPNARFPGTINVAEAAPFGEGIWFGRIRTDGSFEQSGRLDARERAMLPRIVETLRALAANPADVASAHGVLTGRCCFCNRPLTDERSTSVGYGPICADHFGLPWGAPAAEDRPQRRARAA